MKNYEIKDALNTDYGPKISYNSVYVDNYDIAASSDQAALLIAESLQCRHDSEYIGMGVDENSDDYMHAPCYTACLYSDDTGEKIEQ